jgi:hypothetical protein
MAVGFTAFGISASADDTTISTADEYIAFVKAANEAGKDYKKGETVKITADLDFTGKEFVVINEGLFTLDGDGHTLSNINITVSDTATGTYGILANGMTNNNANGTIKNLTLKDSSITVTSTATELPARYNHGNGVSVGGVCGWADRGRVGANVNLDNITINVTGVAMVGSLVGFKEWGAGVSEDVISGTYNVTINAPQATVGLIGGVVYDVEGSVSDVSGKVTVVASANEVTATTYFTDSASVPDNFIAESVSLTLGTASTETPATEEGDGDGAKEEAPKTGSEILLVAAVAVISLAGVVVASKKRANG